MLHKKFKFYKQLEILDCGPACLKMIAKYYGKDVSLDLLREACKTTKLGTSILSLTRGAETIGLESVATEVDIDSFDLNLPLPCIVLINKTHFAVLVNIKYRKGFRTFRLADPGFGMINLREDDFKKKWSNDLGQGFAIFIEPTQTFLETDFGNETDKERLYYLSEFKKILNKYKSGLSLILVGMILGSLMSLAFPLITQKVVDKGIKFRSYDFITIVFIFQLFLFIGTVLIDVIKSWLLLHIGSRLEINLTYDFLGKVMKLPMYFFDRKLTADIMQRIGDNSRIQNFIRSQLLDMLISVASLFTLIFLLLNYNSTIFLIYTAITVSGIFWALYFSKKREILDYRKFDVSTENTENIIETVVSMPEIKLNNAEDKKRSNWKDIQFKLLKINERILKVQQLQSSGSSAINTLKNILITLLAARMVIDGSLTLGEMLAISAVIGQLNLPVYQLTNFYQYFLEAKISFTRLAEVQLKKNEDEGITPLLQKIEIKHFDSINFKNVAFSYTESANNLLFDNIDFVIPRGKITAIVGSSGSGKTTLLKLLLKFYEPFAGGIFFDATNITNISSQVWRSHVGVVMQDGHIFSDTVINNIALSDNIIDKKKLFEAAKIACADSFIDKLPMKYETKIGSSGQGLSAGQKQRLLIARAVYKNPEILIFDEATSALDSTNENLIQKNLEYFFNGRTVVIIAHRLSTVKNADNIIVLESGQIIEQDNHINLISKKGTYFNLVRNQLELEK